MTPERDEPTYYCPVCLDEPSGWKVMACCGVGEAYRAEHGVVSAVETCACARRTDHGPHSYAERCACADTNPVILRYRQAREEARAKHAATQGRRRT